jgi:hypothetical protein
LFSNDEKFEFYVPTGIETYTDIEESDSNNDGVIDTRKTNNSYKFSGINVVSEDGDVIATFRAEGFKFIPEGHFNISVAGDIIYFIFSTDDVNNPHALYKIEKPVYTSGDSPSSILGDLNNDGKVNVADHVKLSDIIMDQNK